MSDEAKTVTACVIIIGDEILSGRTQDKNLSYISTWLNENGIQVREARVVADDEAAIAGAVNECRAKYDYVFTSGGIGPTHDDITSDCIAKAFGVENVLNEEAHAILRDHYAEGDLNEARLRMARIPVGATLVENPVSKAPGYQIGNVFVLAGVPVIMQAMLESLRHRLVGGAPVQSRTIGCELPEGALAAPLGGLQDRYPSVSMGSYPFYRSRRFGVSVVLRSTDEALLEAASQDLIGIMRELGVEPWIGEQA